MVKGSKKRKANKSSEPNAKRLKEGKEVKATEKAVESPIKSSTKPQKATSDMTPASSIFIGAHVSAAGGVFNAVKRASDIGCKSFALFLSNQRRWDSKALDDTTINKFKEAVKEYGYNYGHILPHGSYLMNCGSAKPVTLEKSRKTLVEELKKCELLGIKKYNFHPGSTCGDISREECIKLIAESINLAHKQTNTVMTVIENMSCQGNTIGGKLEELSSIIKQVEDKSRIGVCIDTCHAFAAGNDITTVEGWNKLMEDFENKIGIEYFHAMHLNDSKGKVGDHLDRHEIIGTKKGSIPLSVFRTIVTDPRCRNIPLILETPGSDGNEEENWRREIELLYSPI